MRILVVTNMYPTAARPSFGAFVRSQVDSLEAVGHVMEVLFVDGASSRRNYLAGFGAVRDALERFGPDLIHAHYGLTGFVAACSLPSVPLVLSLCGDDVLGTPVPGGGLTPASRLGIVLSRIACSRAAAVIVKSAEMQAAVAGWGYPGAAVIPNGVDVAFFRPPSGSERSAARERLGMRAGRLHLLFPHTPYEWRKRLDLAEAVARQLGAETDLHVVYHQPRERLRDYYHAADVMLLTSEWEGSPNVVKEAMACDLPTVSFDVGDVRWLTAGCRSHRVVVRRDVDAMSAAVRDAMAGGIRDGSERIRQALSVSATAGRVAGVYAEALRQAGRPVPGDPV